MYEIYMTFMTAYTMYKTPTAMYTTCVMSPRFVLRLFFLLYFKQFKTNHSYLLTSTRYEYNLFSIFDSNNDYGFISMRRTDWEPD